MESKILTGVFAFMLVLTMLMSGAKFHIDICYSDNEYSGQATMYYAHDNQEFDESRSIYTYVDDGKAVFNYDKGYDRLFVVPNRQNGTSVRIKAIKLKLNNISLYTVKGDKLNEWAYANKDENTAVYENGMLTLNYSELNPYPRLIFADEFLLQIKKTQESSAIYLIAASVAFSVLFILLLTAAEIFLDKHPKHKAFLKKHFAKIAFNTALLLLLFMSMRCFNGYMLAVDYETDLSGSNSTVYYDYDDDGFKELNSTYTKIDSLTGQNPFFTVSDVEGLRIVPNRAVDKLAKIKSLQLFHEGVQIKNYTPSELKEKYLEKSEDVLLEDNSIVVENSSKQEAFPIIEFNRRFLDELNRSSALVLFIDIAKTIGYFALMQLCLLAYSLGKKNGQKYLTKKKGGAIPFVFTVLTVLFAILELKALVYVSVLPMLLFGLYAFGAYDKLRIGKTIVYAPLCTLLSAVLLFNMNSGIFAAQKYFVFAFWSCTLLALSAFCYVYSMERFSGNMAKDAHGHIESIAGIFVKTFAAVFIYEYIKINMQMEYNSFAYITEMMLGDVIALNLMLIFAAVCTIYGLVGKRLTNVVFFTVYVINLLGNMIKLTYHNTMLTPADFLEIKDAFSIAPTIMGKPLWYIFLAVLAAALAALLINIKKLIVKIKPMPYLPCFFISVMLMLVLGSAIIKGEYTDINVCDKPYIDEITAERTNGPAIYNMFKIIHIPDMVIKPPKDYNEQTVKEISAEFEKDKARTDNIRPNVICILAESYMDLNSVQGLEFNKDTIPFTREHGFINMISPRYGGYTAAVEYEVLTGMTLAFYPPSVIPYTAYYNNESRPVPSVPLTFKDNGYKTYAIHPNTANFYSRDKAYAMMGFDEYWAIDKFNGAEQVKNNFVKDSELADKITEIIDDNDTPVFTFGITMESHATSDTRFDETTFEVDGELSSAEREDLIQEAEAYRDTDRMIEKLCSYIDTCEEPTILYVFGDHLPPLSVFGNLAYINDVNNKYSTVALCHCNYKDVELKDRTTPNYIAAQMVVDSGVPHSSYFDYIYGLRDRIPILHRDFIVIDKDNNEDLRRYYMVQYDLMFGKQWFYGK